MSSDGEGNCKGQTAVQNDEKPNLDTTDSSQDTFKSETDESLTEKKDVSIKEAPTGESPTKVEDGDHKVKEMKADASEEATVEKDNHVKAEETVEDKEKKSEDAGDKDVKAKRNKDAAEAVEGDECNTGEEEDEAGDEEEEEEEEGDEEDAEEDEDNSHGEEKKKNKKEVPLLDQPLEQSGPRERKKVQRFTEEQKEAPGTATSVEIPNGCGVRLSAIPRIDASISRFKADALKLLHRVLYNTPGKTIQIRKNILKFNGFDFAKGSDAYKKRLALVQKLELKQLKSVCEMLDLEKGGSRDEIGERVCIFLLEPRDTTPTGKTGGGSGRPKRTAAVRANNRGYSSPDNDDDDDSEQDVRGDDTNDDDEGGTTRWGRRRGKGRRSNLKDASSSGSDAEFNPSDSDADDYEEEKRPRGGVAGRRTAPRQTRSTRKKQSYEDASDVDEDEDDDEEETEATPAAAISNGEDSDVPKAKRPKRGAPPTPNNRVGRKPVTAKGVAKTSPVKKTGTVAATPTKKPETKRGRPRTKTAATGHDKAANHGKENNEHVSSSEDEPLVKKSKAPQPPNDEEIKKYVKEILEGANLEEITMKTVCKQVYAHYPDFDLAHKKDFIKTTVKSLIST